MDGGFTSFETLPKLRRVFLDTTWAFKTFEWHFIIVVGSWQGPYNGLLSSPWAVFHPLYNYISRVHESLLNLSLTSLHSAEVRRTSAFCSFSKVSRNCSCKDPRSSQKQTGVTVELVAKGWCKGILLYQKKTKIQNHAKYNNSIAVPTSTIQNNHF